MKNFSRRNPVPLPSLIALAVLFLLPSVTHAHVGAGHAGGLLHGITHPVTGLDHMLAMVAVGLWATQQGGRSLWAIPLCFVCAMVFGGLLAMAGYGLPLVEPGIAASLLILGLLVALALRPPFVVCALLVGFFAVLHGHAHGAEMPETAASLNYSLGFVLSTVLLHGVGIAIGLGAKKISVSRITRYAGGVIATCGLVLLVA